MIAIIHFSYFRKRYRNNNEIRGNVNVSFCKKLMETKILAIVYKYYVWPDLYKLFCSSVMEQHVEGKVSTANWLIWVIWRLHIMQFAFLHTSASHHLLVNTLRKDQKTAREADMAINVLWRRNEGVQLGRIQRLLVKAARQVSSVNRWSIIP